MSSSRSDNVTQLVRSFTTFFWQWCIWGVESIRSIKDVSRMFHGYFQDVWKKFQGCFMFIDVYRCLNDVLMLFQRCFNDVTMMFQRSYNDVSMMFQRCFNNVSMMLHHCFTDVSSMFHRHLTYASPMFHWCFIDVS